MNQPIVISATYESNLKLRIVFSDNSVKIVDFSPFLNHKKHQVYDYYRIPQNFKKFSIEKGNIVWGEDWDLIFPLSQLYKGQIQIH